MKYRDTASYGKRQEYKIISKLLERGFDVYLTLVDDMGIDCVVRINERRYLDIQIKARSKDKCELKQRGFSPQLSIENTSGNYYFILYSEFIDKCWVIPANDIIKMSKVQGTNVSKLMKKENIGKYNVRVASTKCVPLSQFKKYEDAFHLLK